MQRKKGKKIKGQETKRSEAKSSLLAAMDQFTFQEQEIRRAIAENTIGTIAALVNHFNQGFPCDKMPSHTDYLTFAEEAKQAKFVTFFSDITELFSIAQNPTDQRIERFNEILGKYPDVVNWKLQSGASLFSILHESPRNKAGGELLESLLGFINKEKKEEQERRRQLIELMTVTQAQADAACMAVLLEQGILREFLITESSATKESPSANPVVVLESAQDELKLPLTPVPATPLPPLETEDRKDEVGSPSPNHSMDFELANSPPPPLTPAPVTPARVETPQATPSHSRKRGRETPSQDDLSSSPARAGLHSKSPKAEQSAIDLTQEKDPLAKKHRT